ncbi:TetR family transcriptional regulator [Actinophytocola xinjiangensis]|uniref:TetR family transcriptional regulator n=1 Tax=Actinophytocola xinjiangensis TaxID=485602 RepID=A0A7Z0WRY5_9PSEU|nr:TetR/AcrR family transcriptional regulator [Actinophytocola xinjiangensis]OLF14236.1 TetR family transcriptional regulator [Actinophytocola xinjiangensis]
MGRAGITVGRLTVAAAELADELGFENVTVSALARRFGIRDASLYSHIRNLRDLRERVSRLALTELADRAGDALAGRSGRDALVAFADAYRDYATRHPGRYAAGQLPVSPATADAARRHSDLTHTILRGYALPDTEHVHAVRLLHSTFHGYVSLERAGGFDHSGDTTASWRRVLDVLDTTLRNWPPNEAAPR